MTTVAKLALDNIDSPLKSVREDRGAHYIMMKRSIHPEDAAIISIYVPSISSPKCIKQILTELQGEMERNIIRVGDFNTSLSQQEINKDTAERTALTDSNGLCVPHQQHTDKVSREDLFQAQTNPNLRRLKSSVVFFSTTLL